MKNTILVPVDYSENALSAARYAGSLAKVLHWDLQLIHAYQPFTSAFQSPLANETDKEHAAIGAHKGMSEFLAKLGGDENLQIRSAFFEGPLLESVEQACQSGDIGLIVMGTHGASGVRADLIGSNTYHIAKSISKPLVVVPHQYVFKGSLNAVFFTDYHKDDVYTSKIFTHIFHQQFSTISIVHILSGDDLAETSLSKLESWTNSLNPIFQKELHAAIIDLPESVATIDQVLEKSNADMCVLTLAHDRNFFENLFQKSLAKAIIMNPYCPVFLAGKGT